MVYRVPPTAPESQIPPERRGPVLGRFCHVCATVYPLHRATHAGQPVYGRDHIASPCAHEGEAFTPGETWWEPAVEVLPAPAPAPATAAAAPAAGTVPPAAAAPAGAASPAKPASSASA
jgi:hypothetical protein